MISEIHTGARNTGSVEVTDSTPLYAPLEKQRKINGLQFHTGLRKAARSIDRTAFALYSLIILDMSKKSTIPAVDNRIAVLLTINRLFIIHVSDAKRTLTSCKR